MTRDRIATEVHKIIRSHFAQTGHRPQPGEIGDETTFGEMGADSLDTIEIVMNLEEAFDLECPDEVADELHSVGSVVDWLLAQQRAVAA